MDGIFSLDGCGRCVRFVIIKVDDNCFIDLNEGNNLFSPSFSITKERRLVKLEMRLHFMILKNTSFLAAVIHQLVLEEVHFNEFFHSKTSKNLDVYLP